MLYSYKGSFPQKLPFRIRLSNGLTRTDPSTFTPEEIADAGYITVDDMPQPSSPTQVVLWNGTGWTVREKTEQELNYDLQIKWHEVRAMRDQLLKEVDWRTLRYQSQVRLGVTPIDNIQNLDTYAQALRDVTLQPDPFNIVWPDLTV